MTRNPKPSEKELILQFTRMIRATASRAGGVVAGVGDDAAVLRPRRGEDVLVTTDILVEGRHFKREWFTGSALGWRLAAVNLSDIAAMGGRPLYGVLSLALPASLDIAYVHAIERGVRDHLAAVGATIVGGNISGIESTLVCDLTLIGSCRRGTAWRRTCRPGSDAVVVAGFLGDSRAGLEMLEAGEKASGALVRAYKRPVPRIDVAALLTGERSIHGAIDVSDGLSTDVIHMCETSGAGCEIRADRLPVSRALERYCRKAGVDTVSMALRGGEDYALLLAVDSGKAEAVAARIERTLSIPSRVIGCFTAKKGAYVLVRGGRRRPFASEGWDHLDRGRR
jgi:thiamine-monophosphate kinase